MKYEIELTDAVARKLARETVENSESIPFLINIAIEAMDILRSSPTGSQRLDAALKKQGFELHEDPKWKEPKPKASVPMLQTKVAAPVQAKKTNVLDLLNDVENMRDAILRIIDTFEIQDNVLRDLGIADSALLTVRQNPEKVLTARELYELKFDLESHVLQAWRLPALKFCRLQDIADKLDDLRSVFAGQPIWFCAANPMPSAQKLRRARTMTALVHMANSAVMSLRQRHKNSKLQFDSLE